MANVKRYVVGRDENGKSAVLESEPSNVQSKEGFFWRSTHWATREVPVDNTIEGDRAADEELGADVTPSRAACWFARWRSGRTRTPTSSAGTLWS